ncbi:hypothetical protein V6N13_076429 [Hibiscus sabdariffa]
MHPQVCCPPGEHELRGLPNLDVPRQVQHRPSYAPKALFQVQYMIRYSLKPATPTSRKTPPQVWLHPSSTALRHPHHHPTNGGCQHMEERAARSQSL